METIKEEVKDVKKVKKSRFEKGSQSAKDYMASLREKRKAKIETSE